MWSGPTRAIGILLLCTMTACATLERKEADTAETKAASATPAYYDDAILAAKEGDAASAICLLKQVTRENPDFAIAYTDLGLQYLLLDKLDDAEAAFEKSLNMNASDYVAYNHRGVIKRKRGDFDGARDMYETAIRHNPGYANAHLNIGVLFDIYLYDLERAMHHYRQYQTLTDNNDKQVAKWVVDLERRIEAENRERQ